MIGMEKTLIIAKAFFFLFCFFFQIKGASFNQIVLIQDKRININTTTYMKTAIFYDKIYAVDDFGIISKWNFKTGLQQGSFTPITTHQVYDLFVTSNGTELVACYGNSIVRVWNTSDFTILRQSASSSYIFYRMQFDEINQKIIGSIQQQRSFQYLYYQNLTIQKTVNMSGVTTNHKFLYSSSKNILFDWLTTDLIVYNASTNPYTLIQSFAYAPFNAIIYNTNMTQFYSGQSSGTFRNHPQSTYIPTQSKSLSTSKIKDMLLMNDGFQIFLMHTTAQMILYDRINQVSKVISQPTNQTATYVHLSSDKRFVIRVLDTYLKVFNISCQLGYYFQPLISDCTGCNLLCTSCDPQYGYCNGCVNNLTLFVNGSCGCTSGSYFSANQCIPCNLNCTECSNSSSNCTSCISNFNLINNTCIEIITPNTTTSSNQTSPNIVCEKHYILNDINDCQMEELLNILSQIFSIPMIHQSTLFKYIMIYMNELWIYNYHNREYGQESDSAFSFALIIENHKWLPGNYEKQIGISAASFYISNYSAYTNKKFLQKDGNDSYFWSCTFQYFAYSLPLMIIMYLILRKIFFIFFKYRVSRHFRRYSLGASILSIALQSNYVYILYACFNNCINLFYMKFIDKAGNYLFLFVFFVFIIYAFGYIFLIKMMYKRLTKYFIQQSFLKFGSLSLFLLVSFRGLILAAVQSFLYYDYEMQMKFMICIELLMGIGFIFHQIKWRCYKFAFFSNLGIFYSFLMVSLNLSLLLDYQIRQNINQDEQSKYLSDHIVLIILYIISGVSLLKQFSVHFTQRKLDPKHIDFTLEIVSKKQSIIPKQISQPKKKSKKTFKNIQIQQLKQNKKYIFQPIQPQLNHQENYYTCKKNKNINYYAQSNSNKDGLKSSNLLNSQVKKEKPHTCLQNQIKLKSNIKQNIKKTHLKINNINNKDEQIPDQIIQFTKVQSKDKIEYKMKRTVYNRDS